MHRSLVARMLAAPGSTGHYAQSFLHGRSYMNGPVGRRGIVAAFVVTITHCSADAQEFTFPDGTDGEALLRSFLATLAFVVR